MSSITRRFALLAAALALVGCESATQPEAIPVQTSHGADPPAPVLTFDGFAEVGTSHLVRTPNGVNYKLSTTGLVPGHAYTLWIVIFNDTDGCEAGTPGASLCGPADVVNADADPDMMYAGGNVAGGSGNATFAGRRSVEDMGGSANGPVGLPANGLLDPDGAEFHLVVHHHGPKLPAYMPDMIQSIDGGCTDAGVPEAGAPSPWNDYAGPPGVGAFGMRGPNTCASVQFAVHSP